MHRGFIVSHRRDPIPARPGMPPLKVPALAFIGPRDMDGALALHIPD
jgi:hypothetical protein